MQTENDKKDNKRDRQALEEDKSVDSGSPPPKRQKSETEPVAKDVSDHSPPLSRTESNEIKDDKKRTRSLPESEDAIDNGQPSSKRRKVEPQPVENNAPVIPEQSLVTSNIEQRINLLELFLKQDDYFLYFPKKTAYKFTALSKPLMKRYIELADKYKEIASISKKLTFELDIMSLKDLESFNEKAKRARIDREEVCLILKTPQLDKTKEYMPNCKKIVVPTPRIYISPKWKNVIIKYDFLQVWQTNIEVIEIGGRKINSLKLEPIEWEGKTNRLELFSSRTPRFCFGRFIKINRLEVDLHQRYSGFNISEQIGEYDITNDFNAYPAIMESYKDKVKSIISDDDSFENIGWNINEPLSSFINLETLTLQVSSGLMNDKFPLSLKSVEFSEQFAYRHIMHLYNDGMVFDDIEINYLEYRSAEEFMNRCITSSLRVNGGFFDDDDDDLPEDFKITLPKTLERCSFDLLGDPANDDRMPLSYPFLDCSLTDLKIMQAELKMVLTLPHKCVEMDLFLIDDFGDNEDFRDYVPQPEVIAAWIWPSNMERLEIHSSKIFNYNPHVPESLKDVIITEMDELPKFPPSLSNITLETTLVKDAIIDFKLFPDIFTSIDIRVNDANIFGEIGHLNNLRKIFVSISNTIEDRIVFKCPPGLQSLCIIVAKASSAEIQILPNKVLGRVVYRNIAVIMDRELYKGILLKG